MNQVCTSRPRFRPSALLASRRGWIGIDAGSRFLKCAQVSRSGEEWNLSAVRIAALPQGVQFDRSSLAQGALRQALDGIIQSDDGFRGRKAALTLSGDVIELQSSHLPDASDEELRQMIAQGAAEAMGLSDDAPVCEAWSTSGIDHSGAVLGGQKRISGVAVPRGVALRCAEDLMAVGLRCDCLDSLPFALARALTVAEGYQAAEPLAVLDWSWNTPLFSVSVGGVPVFSRVLRNLGLRQLEASVCDSLQTQPLEAVRLLRATGLSAGQRTRRRMIRHAEASVHPVCHVMEQFTRPYAEEVATELERTLKFMRLQMSRMVPHRMWVTGGGGTIPGYPDFIGSRLDIDVRPWQMPCALSRQGADYLQSLPLFAAAAGLSLLVQQ